MKQLGAYLLLVFALTAACAGIARGEDVKSIIQGGGYRLKGTFRTKRSKIAAYVAVDAAGTGQPKKGQFYFIVRDDDEGRWSYGYRLDLLPLPSGGVQVVLRLFDVDNGPPATDGPEPPRALTKLFASGKVDYQTAQALVQEAEGAAADWDAHKRYIDEAFSRKWAPAHEGWRKIAVDLERAHEKHPDHLGILKDLIVAYSQLNAFERHTVRGMNLCSLIPQRIAEYKERAGPLDGAESREFRKAMAMFYFQSALYPLAMAELAPVSDDPEAAVLKQVMGTIGQAGFSNHQSFEVQSQQTVYTVAVYRASRSGPPEAKMPFHHWYFVPTLRGATSPSSVCYSLASHKLTKARRYYLYGHTAGRRKLLMMYGPTMPAFETVEAKVRELMIAALTTADGDWLSGRRLLVVVLGVVLVVAIALRLVLRRRSKALACVIACIVASGFAVSIPAEGNADQAGAKEKPSLQQMMAEVEEISNLSLPDVSHPDQDEAPPQGPADVDPSPLSFPDEPKSTPTPQSAPLASVPALRPAAVQQILNLEMGVIEREQRRILDDVKARKINQEQGRVLLEAVDRLVELAPKIVKARRERIRMHLEVPLERLNYAERMGARAAGRPSIQDTGGRLQTGRTVPPRSISVALAADAFGEARGAGGGRPQATARGAPRATRFFTRPTRSMDDVRPLIRIARSLDSIEVPSPPANKKEKDGYLAKGVKILIDDAMLAEVLRRQDTSATLAEMEELEDALLAARDAEDALRTLQKYTEAKKTAFLDSARKFRNLGNVRLVSLKTLVSKLTPYRGRWGHRPAELRTVGGLTRIHGFFWNRVQEDLLLVGRAEPGDPAILVDSLIVGLRCVWRDGKVPVCSLDSKPKDIAGPQYCYIEGVPKDSSFAEIMLRADYKMKLILFREKGHELGIPGFNPLEKFSGASMARGYNRFWLFPVQPTEREYHAGPGGSSVLFDSQVQVLTEGMAVGERGVVGTGSAWAVREHDTRMFTEHYDEIAEKEPIFKKLRGVFDIVTLGKTLLVFRRPRMAGRGLGPEAPLLNKLVALPYERVDVPRSFPGVTVTHRIGPRDWTFSGGCDIRKRVAARAMVEARSRSLEPLANAAGAAANNGALFHNVAGRPLRLPEPTGGAGAPTERAYAHGVSLLAMGKFEEAREQLTKVIAADPAFAAAYSARAIARFELGERRQAFWDAAAAISLDPREVTYRATYRQLLVDAGIPNALRGIDDATREELANRYVRRGLIKQDSGDRKGAMALYAQALGIDPQNTQALMHRGLAKIDEGKHREAIADFTEVVRIDPQYMHAYIFRGGAKSTLKDYKGAIQDHTKALKIDPQCALAYAFRADAKAMVKDYTGAIDDATKAIARNPSHVDSHYIRGVARIILVEEGARDALRLLRGAEADLRKVIELGNDQSPHRAQARSLLPRVRLEIIKRQRSR